jgi:hypothetical protein
MTCQRGKWRQCSLLRRPLITLWDSAIEIYVAFRTHTVFTVRPPAFRGRCREMSTRNPQNIVCLRCKDKYDRLMQAVRRYDSLLTEQEVFAQARFSQSRMETQASTSAYASSSVPQYQYPLYLPPGSDTFANSAQAWAQGDPPVSNHTYSQVENQEVITDRPSIRHSFEPQRPEHDGLHRESFPQAPQRAVGVAPGDLSSTGTPWTDNRYNSQSQTTSAASYPIDPYPRLPNVPSHALPSLEEITPPRREKQEEALLIEL